MVSQNLEKNKSQPLVHCVPPIKIKSMNSLAFSSTADGYYVIFFAFYKMRAADLYIFTPFALIFAAGVRVREKGFASTPISFGARARLLPWLLTNYARRPTCKAGANFMLPVERATAVAPCARRANPVLLVRTKQPP
jgi:hypothetical protein